MTNEEENNKKHLDDFARFMYQKGYRANYTLIHQGTNHPGMTGILRNCLDKFLTGYKLTNETAQRFQLETHPPLNDHLTCRFRLRFEPVKGFLISEMSITDTNTKRNHTYRISHNQEIPGAVAIQGLFPKPKPWDHILKGKFRP